MLRFRRKSSAKCRRSLIWMTLPDPTRCSGCCPPFALKDRLPKPWPELQMRIMQLAREGSPPPGLRLPQAELSRKPNQIARGRIRRFESYMPSQADRSPHRGIVATIRVLSGLDVTVFPLLVAPALAQSPSPNQQEGQA